MKQTSMFMLQYSLCKHAEKILKANSVSDYVFKKKESISD